MSTPTDFIKELDDEALVYAYVMQKKLYDEAELHAIKLEINRRKLDIPSKEEIEKTEQATKEAELKAREEKTKQEQAARLEKALNEANRKAQEEARKKAKEEKEKMLSARQILSEKDFVPFLFIGSALILFVNFMLFHLLDGIFDFGTVTVLYATVVASLLPLILYTLFLQLCFDTNKIRRMMEENRTKK